ncbi:MAG: NAD+ synthase [Nitrososphaeraceae archaeon]|jgi:NAD+ synthase|nr:NAD+ synthase [Nitrososphaeraceae archaeon]
MSDDFLNLDYGKVAKKITRFISSQVKSRKKSGIVIGLSGGIDSSVCVILACRALASHSIIGLSMPEKNVTPQKDLQNVRSLAKELKIKYREINIERGKKVLLNNPMKDKLAGGNFSARIRMSLLYYYAATNNLLVLGTADKSELMIGYFTKFGDAGADIFPIGELYKSQVRLLGKELQVPEEILRQPSSPGFWKGQLAEKEIGLPYGEIDRILESYLSNRWNAGEFSQRKIKLVTDMIKKNQHKKDAPICNPL